MSFCCGKENPIKRKNMPPVYEKRKPIFNQPAPIVSAAKVGSAQFKANAKPEYLSKKDDYIAIQEEQTEDTRYVMKKIKRCGYDEQELIKKYKGTNKKWDDVDFLHQDIQIRGESAFWKRPEEFIDKPDLFPPEVSPNDVIQGQLNDCYFLSAVSALAEKPYRVDSVFKTKEYNPNGWYICKLNFNGIYQEVIVDDWLPVDKNNKPIYAQISKNRYIYVMILEKCWAKLLHGYRNCNYGSTSQAFQTLCGAPTKTCILRQYAPIDPDFENLYGTLKESDQKHFAVQISRNRAESYQQEKDSVLKEGLPMGHAYSLLGVYETTLKNDKKVRLMQIRNPWGTQQSQLSWSDKDPKWDLVYPDEKQRMMFNLNKTDKDGVFYMEWNDFVKKFDHLFSICQIHDDANYIFETYTAKDRIPIYLDVHTDGSPEDVGLYFVQQMQQHFKESYKYCGISVVASRQGIDKHGEKTYQYLGAFNYFNSPLDNFFTLPIRKAPKGRYLLRVYVYWPQMCQKEAQIVVGLYSEAIVGLRKVQDVDDQEYIQKNCISRSLKSENRQTLQNDPHSWICIEILQNTNIGFVVFHYGNQSTVKDYTLKFDETGNKPLYFLCEYRGQDKFEVDCEKGYQYVIIYAYNPQYQFAMNKDLFPTYDPKFKLPNPEIIVHE